MRKEIFSRHKGLSYQTKKRIVATLKHMEYFFPEGAIDLLLKHYEKFTVARFERMRKMPPSKNKRSMERRTSQGMRIVQDINTKREEVISFIRDADKLIKLLHKSNGSRPERPSEQTTK